VLGGYRVAAAQDTAATVRALGEVLKREYIDIDVAARADAALPAWACGRPLCRGSDAGNTGAAAEPRPAGRHPRQTHLRRGRPAGGAAGTGESVR
jgi:hypothetical protein